MHNVLYTDVSKHMLKIYLQRSIFIILVIFQSCSPEYPESFKVGTFKTITELNTVKYLYRNRNYQYVYSEAHPDGNKLSKITWNYSGYHLETINQTSDFDSLFRRIVLDEYDENSVTETTYAEGFDLKFTTKWTRIDKNPDKILEEMMIEYGVENN